MKDSTLKRGSGMVTMQRLLLFVFAATILFGQDPAQKGEEAGKLTPEQSAEIKLMEANFKAVQSELRAALAEKKLAENAIAEANGRGQALIARYQAMKAVICGGAKVPVDQCELDAETGIVRKNDSAKDTGPAKPEPARGEVRQ